MNIKNMAVIASSVIVVVSLVAFMFFRAVLKESAPPASQPAVPTVPQTEPKKGYEIPENVIPAPEEIKVSIKKETEERKESDKVISEIKAKMAPIREEIRKEAEAADKKAIEFAKSGMPQITNPTTTIVVRSPKDEVKKRLKERGLVAY